MRVFIYMFFLAILLPSFSDATAQCESSVRQNDFVLTSSDKRNREIKVAIRITKYTKAIPYEYEELSYFGKEEPKLYLISKIEVSVNGKRSFIPMSAYSDLTSLRCAYVKVIEDEEVILLSLIGGDAAESYLAEIEIVGIAARRRRVVGGEFPDRAWQITIYSYPDTM